jgi:hypothetical protein
VRLPRSLEDPVEQREHLDPRSVREGRGELTPPAFDLCRREILDRYVPERRQEMSAHDRAVVAQRGRLALAVDLEPRQVLLGCLGERHAGAHETG